jgi:hypothetical protein
MRRSTSRLLITLLLALTIPVQTIAAVAADICSSLGEPHHATAVHDHAAGQGHDGTAGHHHSDEPSDQSTGSAHCPPCASCCTATAISSPVAILIPESPAAGQIAVRPLSFSGIQPDGLDRPPLAL